MLLLAQLAELLAVENLQLERAQRDREKDDEEKSSGGAEAEPHAGERASHGKITTCPRCGCVMPRRARAIDSSRCGDVNVASSTLSSRFSCSNSLCSLLAVESA